MTMKGVINRFVVFLASINLTILILAAILFLIILQVVSDKFIIPFKQWQWLTVIASEDFYQSRGFVAILSLFCINLLACCLTRLPRSIKLLRHAAKELNENQITSLPLVKRFKIKESFISTEELGSAIATHFKKPMLVNKKKVGRTTLYAEKGKYTDLGFYLGHVSLLVVIIGVILSTHGYEYYFDMRENELLDPFTMYDADGRKETPNFSLFCEDIEIIPYEGNYNLSKNQAKLTMYRDGKKIKTQTVDFGHPLSYEGIDIYQNLAAIRDIPYAKIGVDLTNGKNQVYEVEPGSSFKLNETNIDVVATQWKTDALQLRIHSSREQIWVSHGPVGFTDPRLQDCQLRLMDITNKKAITLRAVRDPGRKLIWYAFFCMLIGMGSIFFIPHRQIWLRVDQEEKETVITLAGTNSKKVDSFEKSFSCIVQSINETLSSYERIDHYRENIVNA